MRLKDLLVQQGHFIFRWRSFLPLVLVPLAVPAMLDSLAVESRCGNAWADTWVYFCLVLSLAGLGIRIATVAFVPAGTSGRNTQDQRAHQLNTTGLYSLMRNPLYVGNFISILGVVLAIKSFWFTGLFCLAYALYIERVVFAEEEFLTRRFGDAYTAWAERTPAFFPRFSNWQPPALPASWRTVLRREYNGLFGIITAFVVFEICMDMGLEGQSLAEWLSDDWPWPILFAFGLLTFLVLRTLKKQTRWLHIAGR